MQSCKLNSFSFRHVYGGWLTTLLQNNLEAYARNAFGYKVYITPYSEWPGEDLEAVWEDSY